MKFPCTLKNALLIIRDRFDLSFPSKGLGYLAALLLLLPLLARYKLSCYQANPLLTISALADITLPKTTCHFLLLLVGFDALTYRKDLQLITYTCGSSNNMPFNIIDQEIFNHSNTRFNFNLFRGFGCFNITFLTTVDALAWSFILTGKGGFSI